MSLKFSLSPSKLALYHANDNYDIQLSSKPAKKTFINNKRKENEISHRGRIRLKNSLNWLHMLSRSRSVEWNGRTVDNNYRVSFITLSLPSKQMHSHGDITKKCLNLFLTNIRMKFHITNYIWKAELQKNGNIHYHLVIDKYIHHQAIRKYWNMALAKLGYLTAYAETFKDLSFSEYHYWRCQQNSTDIMKNKKAFKYGEITQWLNPNTTDVKKPRNVKNLVSYIAKYLSKGENFKKSGIYADSLREFTGRLWYCSQSISKLKNVKLNFNHNTIAMFNALKKVKSVVESMHEYCTLLFFNLSNLPIKFRGFFNRLLYEHALRSGYILP